MLHWIGSADWGTVPAWLGAGSLILAFRIFMRDRNNSERSQVDLVGLWGRIDSADNVDDKSGSHIATIKLYIKNGSKLPVVIAYLHHGITGRLIDSNGDAVLAGLSGSGHELNVTRRSDIQDSKLRIGPQRIPPEETWESPDGYEITYTYPRNDSKDGPIWDINYVALRLIVIDNAGRIWEVRPGSGVRARQIHWYSRHKPREISNWWSFYGKDGLRLNKGKFGNDYFIAL
ncbi:hypothetical protein EDD99_4131 [Streptomyces sp. 846.5]|nr:hypothetical protein [Streptomyces sp. 846.5]TDU05606.1 hypothetical protein EDD99_4131 [Streptomyces sp. 846.5]